MKPKQRSLFDNEHDCGCGKKRAPNSAAYYVWRPVPGSARADAREEMVVDQDAHGEPIWARHDLIEFDPFMFSSPRTAKHFATKWGAQVRSTAYRHLVRKAKLG